MWPPFIGMHYTTNDSLVDQQRDAFCQAFDRITTPEEVVAFVADLKRLTVYALGVDSSHPYLAHPATWTIPPDNQADLITTLLWTSELHWQREIVRAYNVGPFRALSHLDWNSSGFDGFGSLLLTVWVGLLEENGDPVPQQLHNPAVFSAKCFAIGLAQDFIGTAALLVIRKGLEKDGPSAISSKTRKILPAAIAWIQHAQHRLLYLSRVDHMPAPQHPLPPDEWALTEYLPIPGDHKGNAVRVELPEGFNMERWLYCRRTMGILSLSEDKAVAELADRCFRDMVTCGGDLGATVPGEFSFWETFVRVAREARKREGREVDMDKVDIDVDWVDVDPDDPM